MKKEREKTDWRDFIFFGPVYWRDGKIKTRKKEGVSRPPRATTERFERPSFVQQERFYIAKGRVEME